MIHKAGAIALLTLLALLLWALLRMRPRWPYLALALGVLLCDAAFRSAAHAGVHIPGVALSVEKNPAGQDASDLDWPNRVMAFAVSTLAIWLTVRPQPRAPLVGAGLALAVPGGALNLMEPLLRGYTTDYLVVGDFVLNVADAGLVTGVALACAGVVRAEVRGARAARAAASRSAAIG